MRVGMRAFKGFKHTMMRFVHFEKYPLMLLHFDSTIETLILKSAYCCSDDEDTYACGDKHACACADKDTYDS